MAAGGLRLYYGADLARYGFGSGHPFGPDRLDAFWEETLAQGLDKRAEIVAPVACTEKDLLRFHTGEYIAKLKALSKTGVGFLDYGDTPAFVGVYEASCFVAGSVLDGARAVITGNAARAFVPIAGLHHARHDSAAGFCAVNDIGVAIEYLRAELGIRRIGYVDIDAHHGDGVFYSYEDDPDLIYADLHEDGQYLYPGTGFAEETGHGAAAGTKLNIPMEPGADDASFRREWPRVEALLRKRAPEIILLQAGADSIKGDPITHMAYTAASHRYAAERLRLLADELCDGRLIGTGGGGYNRHNIASAWNAVVAAWI
jgi:acetoin utilization protein AcuC